MARYLWAAVLPICVTAAWLVVLRPLRRLIEEHGLDRGLADFRLRREWLEARFEADQSRLGPAEAARWAGARWRDDVTWARERWSRRLVALVGVDFQDDPAVGPPQLTAVFEYRRRVWRTCGTRPAAAQPDEAVARSRRYVQVEPPPRRVTR